MSKEKVQLTLSVLGSNYTMLCDPHDRDLLIKSSEYLNDLFAEQRALSTKVSYDRLIIRVAVMVCLELFRERETLRKEASMANEVIEKSSEILKQILDDEKELRN